LGVTKVHHRLVPFEQLPKFPKKFELVTALQVAFNRHNSEKPWGREEWGFFLNDLRYNVLGERGEAYFELNYDNHLGNWYSQDVINLFKSYSASIHAGTLHVKW
jgi:hypothetical protein